MLLILHPWQDIYTNPAGVRTRMKKLEGITLNVNLAGVIPISDKFDFSFIYANPIVIKEMRPDGLLRRFILITGIKYTIY